MNENLEISKGKIRSFIESKSVKICGLCEHWKSIKSDRTDRDHAEQGRARCGLETKIDRPYLHYKNTACQNKKRVSVLIAGKRLQYFEGK